MSKQAEGGEQGRMVTEDEEKQVNRPQEKRGGQKLSKKLPDEDAGGCGPLGAVARAGARRSSDKEPSRDFFF